MSHSERIRDATRSARTVSGICCTALGAGLCLWAYCWVKYVWPAQAGWNAPIEYPFTTLATIAQFVGALLFAVTGVLYYRDSPRARPLLLISSVCLLFEMPLALLALYELATSGK